MGGAWRDGWTLHYEVVGPVDGPPVVLIAGSGEQIGSVEFPDEQCEQMAEAGLRVVRVDNRDNGLSVSDNDPGNPDWKAIFSAIAEGTPPPLAYTLADLGDDVAVILDDVGIDSAVVAGASMGSAISRWTAIRHPSRVRGLLLVMSASGATPGEDGPTLTDEVLRRLMPLMTRQDRDDAISWLVDCWRWLWATSYPFDEEWVRGRVRAAYDRSYRPEGVARNMAAGVIPGLWEAQTSIACPTVVMHGTDDPASPAEHGRAVASRIQRAELWEVPGMGHAMHAELWPEMTTRVAELTTARR